MEAVSYQEGFGVFFQRQTTQHWEPWLFASSFWPSTLHLVSSVSSSSIVLKPTPWQYLCSRKDWELQAGLILVPRSGFTTGQLGLPWSAWSSHVVGQSGNPDPALPQDSLGSPCPTFPAPVAQLSGGSGHGEMEPSALPFVCHIISVLQNLLWTMLVSLL